jgi:hypothetical protein
MENRTHWSTLKFQKYPSRHIKDDSVNKATEWKTNASVMSKVNVVSKVIVAFMLSNSWLVSLYSNNIVTL